MVMTWKQMTKYHISLRIERWDETSLTFDTIIIGRARLRDQNRIITGSVDIEEENADDALSVARSDLKRAAYSMTLVTGIPYMWGEPEVKSWKQ